MGSCEAGSMKQRCNFVYGGLVGIVVATLGTRRSVCVHHTLALPFPSRDFVHDPRRLWAVVGSSIAGCCVFVMKRG